jgi:tripartite ATP-independent transporter DctM subunit
MPVELGVGTTLIVVLAVFFTVMAMEVPIGFCLALAGAVGVSLTRGSDIATSVLGGTPFTSVASYGLAIVPMYIMVGMFAVYARIGEHVFQVADRLMRRVGGGLGMATIAACAGFAAVTGSSVACAATVGRLSIDEMRKRGYSARLATGLVAAAGTLGILIPPSIILAIYGVLTRESIATLLVAGILPGILSALVYMSYVWILGRRGHIRQVEGAAVEAQRVPLRRLPWRGVLRVGVLFAAVMVGVYGGAFTVTESGALGSFFALLFMLYEMRRQGLRRMLQTFRSAVEEVASTTSMSFFVFIGSSIFTFYLVSAGIPQAFTEWVISIQMPPHLVVAMLLAALLPLGMALDSLSIVVIFVPLAYPVVTALGFSGVWFAILFVKLIEIGQVTPPVGINVYVVAGVSRVEAPEVFRGILPFVAVDLVTTTILFLFPGITLWLPGLIGR